MTISRGLLLDGDIVPGTDFVVRDSEAWWSVRTDPNDMRRRQGTRVDTHVAHWSAGHCLTGPDALRRLYRNIEARRKADKTDMSVSCGFGITWDGQVGQYCDLAEASIHVGDRRTYRRSAGTEVTWPGTVEWAEKLGIDPGTPVWGEARGRRVLCMAPNTDVLDAWRQLADALARIVHPFVGIPRQVVRTPGPGFCEHRDVPSPKGKIDACGLLVNALGWP